MIQMEKGHTIRIQTSKPVPPPLVLMELNATTSEVDIMIVIVLPDGREEIVMRVSCLH